MKTPTIVCLFGSALWFSGCVRVSVTEFEGALPENQVTERQHREGEISSANQTVEIENQFGPVVATGVDDNFGWQWDLKCGAKQKAAAEEYVSRCKLEVDDRHGTCGLKLVLPPRNEWRSIQIESALRVRVPKSTKVEAHNAFGPTDVTAVRGPVRVQGQNGRITLKTIEQAVNASASFGSLQVEGVGAATLDNQSGSIEAIHVGGNLVARTSFGRLRAQDVKGTADLHNQSGEIEASGIAGTVKAGTSFARLLVEDTGAATLSNQSGAIEALRVAGDLEARTSFARLSARNIQGTADLDNQGGEIIAEGVTGSIKAQTTFARMSLAGQGAAVRARNQSGAIKITAPALSTTLISAETSFAPVELWLAADAKPLIRAQTSFGEVHSDFPVVMMGTLSESQFASDPAAAKVTLKTQNGDLLVRRIPAK